MSVGDITSNIYNSAINYQIVKFKSTGIVYRVKQLIWEALGPFFPNEQFLFDEKEGWVTLRLEATRRKWKGRTVHRIAKSEKAGFFESLYGELPPKVQRRFLLLANEEDQLTQRELRQLEREIVGHARRKLMRELVERILKLPHLRGHNGKGRMKINADEHQRIRNRVKAFMDSGNEGEGMSKTDAIKQVAGLRGLSPRHVWRIVLGH